MFDAIGTLFTGTLLTSEQLPPIEVRKLNYPKTAEDALRQDWESIGQDWKNIGNDMRMAIQKTDIGHASDHS